MLPHGGSERPPPVRLPGEPGFPESAVAEHRPYYPERGRPDGSHRSYEMAAAAQRVAHSRSAPLGSPLGRQEAQGFEESAGRGPAQQQWQDPHAHLDPERKALERELQEKGEEVGALAREAQQLRDQIQEELAARSEASSQLGERLRGLEQDNELLRGKLTRLQLQDSAKLSDVTMVKKDVVWKTMELEKALREFQQGHQDHLFSRLWSVTGSLMSVCSDRPDASPLQFSSTGRLAPDHLLSATKDGGVGMPAVDEEDPSGTAIDAETQQALKRRLQALGDVVVYTNAKYEACAVSGRAIPPGALRIRPRRCDHVFLVDSLMPYWADGLCPVCRCSFAYDRPQDTSAAVDDIDRYSSVSLSVSQVASLALPRPPFLNSSNSDGSLLRGPRTAPRGRSVSASRTSGGRRRSPSQGARSDDALGTPAGQHRQRSPVAAATHRERSASPPRSVASPRSHASSAREQHRSMSADASQQGAGRQASQHGTGRPL